MGEALARGLLAAGALDASDGAVARSAETAAEEGHEPVLAALREEQARRETMLSEVSA